MPDNSSNNKRIARNTLFLYLRMFFVLAVTLYTSRVVLNVLGVYDFGTYNVVCGFVSMFAFLNTAMSNATQRFYNYEIGRNQKGIISKVYTSSLITQTILMIGILLVAETFGIWYLNNVMVIPDGRFEAACWIFQLSLFSFALVIMQVPYTAAIMAYEKMDFYAIVCIIDVLLKLAAVVILQFIAGDKLIWYGAALTIASGIVFLLNLIYSKKHFREIVFMRNIDKKLSKEMFSFSWWNIFGSFAYMIKGQGLNLLLNSFFGTAINAARGVSYQVMNAIQGFANNVFTAFRPQLTQSYAAQEYDRTEHLMFSMSKITFYLFYLLALPIMLEVDYVLHLWLGDVVPDYTQIFTVLIIANMLVTNFNTPLSQVIHATGKMKKYQIVTSVIICSILPLSWIALKVTHNPIYVYIISFVISIINQIVCLFVVKQFFTYSIRKYLLKVIIPCTITLVVASVLPTIAHLMLPQNFIRLAVVSLFSLISVTFFSYMIGMDASEKLLVNSAKDKILNKLKK